MTEPRQLTNRNGGSVPVPDPTALTTAQLQGAIASVEKVMDTRLDAMDKAQTLFRDSLNRVAVDAEKQIDHLQELHEEKFKSVQTQFMERDSRTEQGAEQNKLAIDAAFAAADKASGKQNDTFTATITKSEFNFTKLLDQLRLLSEQQGKTADDKISALDKRVTLVEGEGKGKSAQSATTVTVTGVVFAVILGVAGLAVTLSRGNGSTPQAPQVVYVPQPAPAAPALKPP